MRLPFLVAVLLPLATACAQQPVTTISPGFPDKLKAVGTEPFWSLQIDGGQIAYSTAEEPKNVVGRVARSEAGNVLTLTGTLRDDAMRVRIVPETCSDGMSDLVYPYAVTIQLGAQKLQGCAHPPGLPAKAP